MDYMMIPVRGSFVQPDISNIKPEEWEIIITSACALHNVISPNPISTTSAKGTKISTPKKETKETSEQSKSQASKQYELLLTLSKKLDEMKKVYAPPTIDEREHVSEVQQPGTPSVSSPQKQDSSTSVKITSKSVVKTSVRKVSTAIFKFKLDNSENSKLTIKHLFIKRARGFKSIDTENMANELGINIEDQSKKTILENILSEIGQEYISGILNKNVLKQIYNYIQEHNGEFPPRFYLTKAENIISERDYNSIKRVIPSYQNIHQFVQEYYAEHIDDIDIDQSDDEHDSEAENEIIKQKLLTASKCKKPIAKKLPPKRGKKKAKPAISEDDVDEPIEPNDQVGEQDEGHERVGESA
jgi:hypothetical protein